MSDLATVTAILSATSTLVKSASGFLNRGADTLPGPDLRDAIGVSRNASEALLDLHLPDSVQAVLSPTLQEMGIRLEIAEVPERYGTGTRRYTRAVRGNEVCVLFHVPNWVLDKFAASHRDALASLAYDFVGTETIYVLSRDLDAPERALRLLIEKGWAAQRITGVFIPWRDIKDLPTARDARERRRIVEDLLRLTGPAAGDGAGAPPPVRRLKAEHLRNICAIVMALPEFKDDRSRSTLMDFAGLGALFEGFPYGGDGGPVSRDIVVRLDGHGLYGGPPGTDALGLFLNYLCTIEHLPVAAKAQLEGIIKDYKLFPSVSTFLTPPERIAVRKIVLSLGEFSDRRGRATLLEFAGLGRFLAALDLNGSPGDVAGELVITLEKYGELPDQPSYHALGALLAYVVTLDDLPVASARQLAEIIVKYSLVADEIYLAKLRADFGLTTAAVRSSATTPPSRAPVSDPRPDFVPALGDEHGLEALINSEDNFLDVELLAGALYCAQAVCRIEGVDSTPIGTGVLIGPDLVLTNNHVLASKAQLEGVAARFNYKLAGGIPFQGEAFAVGTDFYESSPETELDYALIRLVAAPLASLAPATGDAHATIVQLAALGRHRGYVESASRFIKRGDRVNIIQHPNGDPLKIVLTQNYVALDMSERRVQYVADTMPGSSGSPVFNRKWELVALHHSGAPYPPDAIGDVLKKAWKGQFRVNEGIPMRAILADFKARGFDQWLPSKIS